MLLQELRRAGMSVTASKVKGTDDKVTRLNSVADLFHSGLVFYIPTQANERTVQQTADFPATDHDDLVDTTSQALRYVRKGGMIELPMDYKTNPGDAYEPPINGYY
jgi:predicted phage terminase large subunit-like protein